MNLPVYSESQMHDLSPEELDNYQTIMARHMTQMPVAERAQYKPLFKDIERVRAYRKRLADRQSNKQ